jgi:DHA1 family tetracycline resistance protein-like MFS transporter
VPDNSQGELQGAVNAASSLATIIGPLAATQIFSYYTTNPDSAGYFPGAPFLAASVSVVAALVLFAFAAWRFELGRRPSVADHPHAPEMAPPGQVRVPPIDEEDDTGSDANPPRN